MLFFVTCIFYTLHVARGIVIAGSTSAASVKNLQNRDSNAFIPNHSKNYALYNISSRSTSKISEDIKDPYTKKIDYEKIIKSKHKDNLLGPGHSSPWPKHGKIDKCGHRGLQKPKHRHSGSHHYLTLMDRIHNNWFLSSPYLRSRGYLKGRKKYNHKYPNRGHRDPRNIRHRPRQAGPYFYTTPSNQMMQNKILASLFVSPPDINAILHNAKWTKFHRTTTTSPTTKFSFFEDMYSVPDSTTHATVDLTTIDVTTPYPSRQTLEIPIEKFSTKTTWLSHTTQMIEQSLKTPTLGDPTSKSLLSEQRTTPNALPLPTKINIHRQNDDIHSSTTPTECITRVEYIRPNITLNASNPLSWIGNISQITSHAQAIHTNSLLTMALPDGTTCITLTTCDSTTARKLPGIIEGVPTTTEAPELETQNMTFPVITSEIGTSKHEENITVNGSTTVQSTWIYPGLTSNTPPTEGPPSSMMTMSKDAETPPIESVTANETVVGAARAEQPLLDITVEETATTCITITPENITETSAGTTECLPNENSPSEAIPLSESNELTDATISDNCTIPPSPPSSGTMVQSGASARGLSSEQMAALSVANLSLMCITTPACVNEDDLDRAERMSRLLQFKAHMHHDVYEIGHKPHEHVNLTMIQNMIDQVRAHNNYLGDLDDLTTNAQAQTECLTEINPMDSAELDFGAQNITSETIISLSSTISSTIGQNELHILDGMLRARAVENSSNAPNTNHSVNNEKPKKQKSNKSMLGGNINIHSLFKVPIYDKINEVRSENDLANINKRTRFTRNFSTVNEILDDKVERVISVLSKSVVQKTSSHENVYDDSDIFSEYILGDHPNQEGILNDTEVFSLFNLTTTDYHHRVWLESFTEGDYNETQTPESSTIATIPTFAINFSTDSTFSTTTEATTTTEYTSSTYSTTYEIKDMRARLVVPNDDQIQGIFQENPADPISSSTEENVNIKRNMNGWPVVFYSVLQEKLKSTDSLFEDSKSFQPATTKQSYVHTKSDLLTPGIHIHHESNGQGAPIRNQPTRNQPIRLEPTRPVPNRIKSNRIEPNFSMHDNNRNNKIKVSSLPERIKLLSQVYAKKTTPRLSPVSNKIEEEKLLREPAVEKFNIPTPYMSIFAYTEVPSKVTKENIIYPYQLPEAPLPILLNNYNKRRRKRKYVPKHFLNRDFQNSQLNPNITAELLDSSSGDVEEQVPIDNADPEHDSSEQTRHRSFITRPKLKKKAKHQTVRKRIFIRSNISTIDYYRANKNIRPGWDFNQHRMRTRSTTPMSRAGSPTSTVQHTSVPQKSYNDQSLSFSVTTEANYIKEHSKNINTEYDNVALITRYWPQFDPNGTFETTVEFTEVEDVEYKSTKYMNLDSDGETTEGTCDINESENTSRDLDTSASVPRNTDDKSENMKNSTTAIPSQSSETANRSSISNETQSTSYSIRTSIQSAAHVGSTNVIITSESENSEYSSDNTKFINIDSETETIDSTCDVNMTEYTTTNENIEHTEPKAKALNESSTESHKTSNEISATEQETKGITEIPIPTAKNKAVTSENTTQNIFSTENAIEATKQISVSTQIENTKSGITTLNEINIGKDNIEHITVHATSPLGITSEGATNIIHAMNATTSKYSQANTSTKVIISSIADTETTPINIFNKTSESTEIPITEISVIMLETTALNAQPTTSVENVNVTTNLFNITQFIINGANQTELVLNITSSGTLPMSPETTITSSAATSKVQNMTTLPMTIAVTPSRVSDTTLLISSPTTSITITNISTLIQESQTENQTEHVVQDTVPSEMSVLQTSKIVVPTTEDMSKEDNSEKAYVTTPFFDIDLTGETTDSKRVSHISVADSSEVHTNSTPNESSHLSTVRLINATNLMPNATKSTHMNTSILSSEYVSIPTVNSFNATDLVQTLITTTGVSISTTTLLSNEYHNSSITQSPNAKDLIHNVTSDVMSTSMTNKLQIEAVGGKIEVTTNISSAFDIETTGTTNIVPTEIQTPTNPINATAHTERVMNGLKSEITLAIPLPVQNATALGNENMKNIVSNKTTVFLLSAETIVTTNLTSTERTDLGTMKTIESIQRTVTDQAEEEMSTEATTLPATLFTALPDFEEDTEEEEREIDTTQYNEKFTYKITVPGLTEMWNTLSTTLTPPKEEIDRNLSNTENTLKMADLYDVESEETRTPQSERRTGTEIKSEDLLHLKYGYKTTIDEDEMATESYRSPENITETVPEKNANLSRPSLSSNATPSAVSTSSPHDNVSATITDMHVHMQHSSTTLNSSTSALISEEYGKEVLANRTASASFAFLNPSLSTHHAEHSTAIIETNENNSTTIPVMLNNTDSISTTAVVKSSSTLQIRTTNNATTMEISTSLRNGTFSLAFPTTAKSVTTEIFHERTMPSSTFPTNISSSAFKLGNETISINFNNELITSLGNIKVEQIQTNTTGATKSYLNNETLSTSSTSEQWRAMINGVNPNIMTPASIFHTASRPVHDVQTASNNTIPIYVSSETVSTTDIFSAYNATNAIVNIPYMGISYELLHATTSSTTYSRNDTIPTEVAAKQIELERISEANVTTSSVKSSLGTTHIELSLNEKSSKVFMPNATLSTIMRESHISNEVSTPAESQHTPTMSKSTPTPSPNITQTNSNILVPVITNGTESMTVVSVITDFEKMMMNQTSSEIGNQTVAIESIYNWVSNTTNTNIFTTEMVKVNISEVIERNSNFTNTYLDQNISSKSDIFMTKSIDRSNNTHSTSIFQLIESTSTKLTEPETILEANNKTSLKPILSFATTVAETTFSNSPQTNDDDLDYTIINEILSNITLSNITQENISIEITKASTATSSHPTSMVNLRNETYQTSISFPKETDYYSSTAENITSTNITHTGYSNDSFETSAMTTENITIPISTENISTIEMKKNATTTTTEVGLFNVTHLSPISLPTTVDIYRMLNLTQRPTGIPNGTEPPVHINLPTFYPPGVPHFPPPESSVTGVSLSLDIDQVEPTEQTFDYRKMLEDDYMSTYEPDNTEIQIMSSPAEETNVTKNANSQQGPNETQSELPSSTQPADVLQNIQYNQSDLCLHPGNDSRCVCILDSIVFHIKSLIETVNTTQFLYSIKNLRCNSFEIIDPELIITNNIVITKVNNRTKRHSFEYINKWKRSLDFATEITNSTDSDESQIDNYYIIPGGHVDLGCMPFKELFTIENEEVKYAWLKDGMPITESRVQDNSGQLSISNIVASDAGNYTCTISLRSEGETYPVNDGYYEKNFAHQITVVDIPIYTFIVRMIYNMSTKCETQDIEIVNLYLPEVVRNVVCGKQMLVCDVDVENALCDFAKKTGPRLTLNFEIYVTELSQLFTFPENFDVGLRLATESQIAVLVSQNIPILFNTPVLFRLPYRVSDLHPERFRKTVDNVPQIQLLVGCPAGYQLDANVCVPCPIGYFSADTTENCVRCPSGTFQGEVGSKACMPCEHPFQPGCYDMYATRNRFYFLMGLLIIVFLFAMLIFCCVRRRKKPTKDPIIQLESNGVNKTSEVPSPQTDRDRSFTIDIDDDSEKDRKKNRNKIDKKLDIIQETDTGSTRNTSNFARFRKTYKRKKAPDIPPPDFE